MSINNNSSIECFEKHNEPKRRTSCVTEAEELRHMPLAPPRLRDGGLGSRKRLSKQLSMCETSRDVAWERRRRQILLLQERRRNGIVTNNGDCSGEHELTDYDLNELKGCIELGFGFNEEGGGDQRLCETLPALDLYYAVSRTLSPVSTPKSRTSTSSSTGRSSPFGSPRSDSDHSWKICSPGEDPEQVKTKLRHWAQAVACSVMQSYP